MEKNENSVEHVYQAANANIVVPTDDDDIFSAPSINEINQVRKRPSQATLDTNHVALGKEIINNNFNQIGLTIIIDNELLERVENYINTYRNTKPDLKRIEEKIKKIVYVSDSQENINIEVIRQKISYIRNELENHDKYNISSDLLQNFKIEDILKAIENYILTLTIEGLNLDREKLKEIFLYKNRPGFVNFFATGFFQKDTAKVDINIVKNRLKIMNMIIHCVINALNNKEELNLLEDKIMNILLSKDIYKDQPVFKYGKVKYSNLVKLMKNVFSTEPELELDSDEETSNQMQDLIHKKHK